ncbi:GDYXXLXY domain-containing protein [Paenibacillus sp. PK4536]|uniref:GDYXXLXY domain-containing protein n=1 Tax=Paenibacillus sp. PK4536 TaxID=3024576 RepID=UPI002358D747|nr:GDYXXLXY domain-containing protein [Paenibacillus sp. PK4536]WIM38469.1 GDYXXLXY domain-containing protein [Paenibacillus sp. PK4536]
MDRKSMASRWINYHTVVKEQLLASGTAITLELAPIDLRSLLQEDYVILNYDISTLPESITQSLLDQNIHSGRIQLVLQPNESLQKMKF